MKKLITKLWHELNWGLEPTVVQKQDSPSNSSLSQERSTLVSLLTSMQSHCFDLESSSSEESYKFFEQWIEFIKNPVNHSFKKEVAGYPRRWEGLNDFFESHREKEFLYVEKSLKNLRSMIWSFVSLIGQRISSDQKSKERIDEQLLVLHQTMAQKDLNVIRTEVKEVIRNIQSCLDDSQSHQQLQMQTLQKQLFQLKEELSRTQKELALDPLTRLYNRSSLDQHIQSVWNLSKIYLKPSTLLMVDLDHFKKVNDTYGHLAGDEVLKQVTNLLVRQFPRKVDFVGRYGGEEFCVVVDRESAQEVLGMAYKLLEATREKKFEIQNQTISLTLSIGMAETRTCESPEDWIRQADQALYLAKQQGRDRVVISDPETLENSSDHFKSKNKRVQKAS